MTNHQRNTPLVGVGALDLTGWQGYLCGQLLGDLGADVIKIEPPGGDPGRNKGPFYHDIEQPEKSLYWLAFNHSKKGITLNIESAAGQDIFKQLVQGTDFILESFKPGYMDKLGLGYAALSKINPKLIMTSITPFGQTGPYRNYKGYNITMIGMGGLLYPTGDPDRSPLCIPAEQAFTVTGAMAMSATMLAYWYRQNNNGEGQHVDVSIQETIMRSMMLELGFWDFQHSVVKRYGPNRLRGKIVQRSMWPCKDGYVNFQFFGGEFGARQVRQLVKWMDELSFASPLTEKVKTWESIDLSTVEQVEVDSWDAEFQRFISDKTKEYLYEECFKRGIFLGPAYNIKDVAESKHLRSRNFWVDLPHPELGEKITYPGPFYQSNEAMPMPKSRAPLIGEHNHEIYCQKLGMTEDRLAKLKEEGVV